MKRTDWALIISVLLYSILFYEQSAGVNFFLFNIGLVGLLLFRDKTVLKNWRWISIAVGALVSSFFIFMYGSTLAIWANLFSLAILAVISLSEKSSFFMSIFVTICSVGASCVFMILDWIKRKKNKIEGIYKRPAYVKIFLFVIPFLIAILFFFFYQSANPLFYEFTKDINLDFISFKWIFFTLSGLLIMYGFYHNKRMDAITNIDVNAATNLTSEIATRKNFLNGLMRLDTERISGVVLFGMLNLLLLLLNVLDINYFLFDRTLPDGINHKDFVHDGIGVLIMSIVIAILIILFYFRGGLNFDEKNKWLKIMAIFWIAQNAFMVFSSAYRNNMYIEESGLSYKKIGVYVYLALALIGLITTYIKIKKVKTNWYLFRVNSAVYYYFIVLACMVNWDVMITNFNISKHQLEGKKLEKYFLLDLSYKNLPQLLLLPEDITMYDDYAARDYYFSSRSVYYRNFKSGLHTKFYNFLDDYQKLDWQSTCMEKDRVYSDLLAMKDKITDVDLSGGHLKTLQPIKQFTAIEKLNLSKCYFDSLQEITFFPKLKSLNLGSNQLSTIAALPEMSALNELVLSENNIVDYSKLKVTPNLTILDISGNKINDLVSLPEFNNLKELNISGNSIKNFEVLEKYKKLETLKLSQANLSQMDFFPVLLSLKSLEIANNSLYHPNSNSTIYTWLYNQLAKQINLIRLDISNNPITDINVLTNRIAVLQYNVEKNKLDANRLLPVFPELKELKASNCSLRTIYTIYVYSSLKKVDLSNNEIENTMPLLSLTSLEELDLSYNKIIDLRDVKALTNLKNLNLAGNYLHNYSSLASLTKLEELNLSAANIKNVSFLKSLKSLKKLNLNNNQITDLTPLASLENLEEINLTECLKDDFSFLLKLKKLKKIVLINPERKLLIKLTRALPNVDIQTVLNSADYELDPRDI